MEKSFRYIVPLLLLAAVVQPTYAQENEHINTAFGKMQSGTWNILSRQIKAALPVAKANGIAERMIAYSYTADTVTVDSIRCYYSGTHGSELNIFTKAGYYYNFPLQEDLNTPSNVKSSLRKHYLLCDSAKDFNYGILNWVENFGYDANDNLKLYSRSYPVYYNQVAVERDSFSYNADNNVTYIHSEIKDSVNGSWRDNRLFYYLYDSAGRPHQDSLFWTAPAYLPPGWLNESKYSYFYNSNGNLGGDSLNPWQVTPSPGWVPATNCDSFTYDTNNRLLTHAAYTTTALPGGQWSLLHTDTFFYNGTGSIPYRHIITANGSNASIDDIRLFTNAAGLIDSIYELYTYDTANSPIDTFCRTYYTYNSYGHAISETIYQENFSPCPRIFKWYYEAYNDGTPPAAISGNKFQAACSVYPNPSSGDIYVSLPHGDDWKVNITDMSGRVIRAKIVQKTEGFTVLHIDAPEGVFLVSITNTISGESVTEKVILKH